MNTADIIIDLPWSKPPLTGNRTRGNPYARAGEVKAAKAEAVAAIVRSGVRRIVGAEITLHFQPDTRLRRDADGLFPTLKVCQDALVPNVLLEDSWVTVPAATCRIHPPVRGEPARMWLVLSAIHEYEEQP